MHVCSLEAEAIGQGLPLLSVLGHPLLLSLSLSLSWRNPSLLCSFLVSLPGVSRTTSSPLPWRVPSDGLTDDGSRRLWVLSTSIFSSLFNFLWVFVWSVSRV